MKTAGLGTVAHICNPSYLGDGYRLGNIIVQGWPKQKVLETPSQPTKKLGMVAHVPSQLHRNHGPGINLRPYSKNK
jgi:hypothetical protein